MEDTPHMGAITFGGTTSPVALFKALAAAQAEMLPAVKDGANPHFRSRYATLAAVLQAILPALNSNGLALSQHPGMDGATVTVTTLITHESGQWMTSTVSAPLGGRKDAQAVGSAITYLRRYAAQSIAGLPVEDDDGNSASAPRPSRRDPVVPQRPTIVPQKASLELVTVVGRLEALDLTIGDLDTWCQAMGKPVPADMDGSTLATLVHWLEGPGAAKVRQWFQDRADGGAA